MMELNLQIIKEDLHDLKFESRILDTYLVRQLTHPVIFTVDADLSEDRLYLIEADKMPGILNLKNRPSFISIGIPPSYLLTSNCNILYTTEPIQLYELLNRLTDLYQTYSRWEKKLQTINNQRLPLQSLAEASIDLFNNPISLYESNFKAVFIVVDTSIPVPESYIDFVSTYDYLSIADVNKLNSDPEYNEAATKTEPAIYSDRIFGFRTLFYNICSNGEFIARLIIDELIRPFTDRDCALIKVLADAIQIGLHQKDLNNLNQPRELQTVLKRLLDHKLVPTEKIESVLRENKWVISDRYFCICIEQLHPGKSEDPMTALAYHLSRINIHNCHIIYQDNLIFLFNLSKSSATQIEILDLFCIQLESNHINAGISSVFSNFKNFYYYYLQAYNAVSIGKHQDHTACLFNFEDYILPFVISKCNDKTIPELFCPAGLLRLLEYDAIKGTDYADLLRIHLENNMHIAVTTRQTFLHRSTFIYRIEKITDILKMDLNNSDVRLTLLMAFKILRSRKE
jgi:hypothetical protein